MMDTFYSATHSIIHINQEVILIFLLGLNVIILGRLICIMPNTMTFCTPSTIYTTNTTSFFIQQQGASAPKDTEEAFSSVTFATCLFLPDMSTGFQTANSTATKPALSRMASVADDQASHAEPEHMPDEDAEEELHHLECNVAMLQYFVHLSEEISRRERHLMKIPNNHRSILPFEQMVSDIVTLKKAAVENQKLLFQIVNGSIYDKHRSYLNAQFATCTARPHHMSKVKTTIEQIVRDWSKEGAAERKECYEPLIKELMKRLPITSAGEQHSVLVPGFGLARILLEVSMPVRYAKPGLYSNDNSTFIRLQPSDTLSKEMNSTTS